MLAIEFVHHTVMNHRLSKRLKDLVFATLCVGCLALPLNSQAASTDEQLLQLERRFLGYEQSALTGTTTSQRLETLETIIYGEPQTGSDAVRLQHLSSLNRRTTPAAPIAELTSPKTPPKTPSQGTQQPPSSTEQYPLVTALEQRILHRTFPTHPLPIRLDRLEFKLYKSTFPHQSLSERMDQIVRRFPEVISRVQRTQQNTPQNTPPMPTRPSNQASRYSQANLYRTIGRLEISTFQQTYPNLGLPQRVTHLEQSRLGVSYPNDPMDVRLKRLF